MAERYYIDALPELADRTFFYDTNVLLYLYYPTMAGWAVTDYSHLFADMLEQKMNMVIDSSVLSEFINRALRIDYTAYNERSKSSRELPQYAYFKNFRNSTYGEESVEHIQDLAKVILTHFGIDTKSISKADIEKSLKLDSLDFNDKLIENICESKGYILVTNDLDFKDSRVDILSAHRGFLEPTEEQ